MLTKRLVTALLTAVTCTITTAAAVPAQAAASTAIPVPSTGEHLMPAGGVFEAGTAWKLDVRNAPLHANSAGMVKTVADQTAALYGGVAAFNAYQYSTSFYTVPADQPRVDVQWDNCQGKNYTPPGLLGPEGQFTQVPIPADAVPAKGTDSQLTVYSPSTDQLWEFWVTKKTADGSWSACWGGRIDGVSQSDGFFLDGFGASASGLSLAGGTIGIEDVRSGVIDHALALHMSAPGTWQEFSYPAQRSDGFDTSVNRVPEGTRLRLDPSVDVDALKMHPIAKMVAKAAQKYGFIVTDKAGCTAVVAESPQAEIAATGVDPWKQLMGSTPSYSIMKNFPWGQLQALPRDYAKRTVAPATPSTDPGTSPTAPTAVSTRYVSDTTFRTVRNGWGPVEKDRSNGESAAGDGRGLKIAGVSYAKGLGVHASSEVIVPVEGAKTFSAQVGVDGEVGTNGSVVFQVWNGATKLADSGTLRGGQAAKTLTADVTGASEIRLVVTDSGNGSAKDHADWANAKLLTPVATTTTAPTITAPTTTAPTAVSTRYVSDTTFRTVRNGWGPVEKDRSNGESAAGDGRGLKIAGVSYAKGLGVHASSEVIVPVEGAKTFSAQVGVDGEVGTNGSVVFQVWNGATKLADSGTLRGGQAAKTLTADVTGASEIRLVVTDSGNGRTADHADWADAKLLG
ncbi:NPCBM/NEW2 domain-containing protein [Kineococcus auxinigenes]|uniref:NPCBM/NEW2 domain-containing protein n=1 Tax=unclassified Kineococcus TaxID=2621656 RepID=UPI003D7CDDD1